MLNKCSSARPAWNWDSPVVLQNSVFSGNSGVLGADIGLLFPLLRSCYFRFSVRLLDLRPCRFYLRDGAGMGTREAGSGGERKKPPESTLISRPTLFPITCTWYSPLLRFASADSQISISHPALPKTPRPDVYPMDASENRAHARSSPPPTSQTGPLFSQVHSRLRLFSPASNQKSSVVQFISETFLESVP